MTLKENLKAISSYPIPNNVLEAAALIGGISLEDEATLTIIESVGYLKTTERVLSFLISAPQSINEMGISYSLGDYERSELRKQLTTVQNKISLGEGTKPKTTGFGFYGDAL